jgi:hypothetical protein
VKDKDDELKADRAAMKKVHRAGKKVLNVLLRASFS